MKYAVIVFTALAGVALLLLTTAASNTDLFAHHYPWLLGANGAVALVLLVLVGNQLRHLWRDVRNGVFGSRIKLRLLWTLALMAVLPGILLYGVSMQFAVRSIDSWFDVRVDSALEGGLELGRNVLASLQADLRSKGRSMALDLGDGATDLGAINRLREQAGVQTASIINGSAQIEFYSTSSETAALMPPLPTQTQIRQARAARTLTWVDGDAKSGLLVHVLVPLVFNLDSDRYLQLTQPVPVAVARSAESVESAYREYQGLQLAREGLKRIYTLTLTLTLLLALFAAAALAFFLAKRLARPLLILAEGTQAVAAGDFTPRTILETPDELGILTRSFNQMTRQLDDARRETERNRGALEAARAYLESVLTNLSAGVLAFDADFQLRAANRGALQILGDDLDRFEEMALSEWPRQLAFATAVTEGFAAGAAEWQRELEIEIKQGAPKILLVRGSVLPSGGGYVVVFDDISQLIAAQRSAAWGEVARRLAHEIKNPLTPIQLSAERLQIKLASHLGDADREMLERSTRTIVNQVEAMKNMVNDFRDYARLPPPNVAEVDLNALIREVLGLYESSRVRVEADLAEDLPPVLADANQLRQVIHNLLANADDALVEAVDPQVTLFSLLDGSRAVLAVSDNGPGFPAQTLARAFEPYVTTKAKGTGLGLAIVKKIIDEHGGEVRLANRDGGGAEVVVRLRLANRK